MSRDENQDQKGRAGVHAVGLVVVEQLGWIFREQPTDDFGVDAHAEVIGMNGPTGQLVALQIKNGASYLQERTPEGYVFRGKQRHLDYWLNHSLPVVVVLRDPETGRCFWQAVTPSSVKSSGKGWKLIVPFAQELNASAKPRLAGLFSPSRYEARRAELVLAKSWMELLERQKRLILTAEEWVNKSSGRGSLQLMAIEEGAEEGDVVRDWPFVMFPGMPYPEVFPGLFPWARVHVDDDFYYDLDLDYFKQENGTYDREDGVWFYDHDNFREWRSRLAQIRPYLLEGGEVAYYRLELTLNDVGRAFLALDRYLVSGAIEPVRAGFDPTGAGHGLKSLTRRYLGGTDGS